MADPFIGEIRMLGCQFAPMGWAFCAGQILPITQNTALFAVIGTTYGGDGQTTFALPNLQGRVPICMRQGSGLTNRSLGQAGGSAQVTLDGRQFPRHTHAVTANASAGGSESPTDHFFGRSQARAKSSGYVTSSTSTVSMAPGAVSTVGEGQPHNNLPPVLALNFCIAMEGIFPPRG
jgi:microcystin-dependent protein